MDFGTALKQARLAMRFTLREVSHACGLSIGYLSDIEWSRKAPPDLDTVRKLQDFLGVVDNSLVELAASLKKKMPEKIKERMQTNSQFRELLYRANELDDDQFGNWLDKAEQLINRGQED